MELLEQIEAYLVRSSVSPSTFGRLVIGDPRLVGDLRSGRRPRRKTLEKVQAYLAAAGEDCQHTPRTICNGSARPRTGERLAHSLPMTRKRMPLVSSR